MEGTLPQGLAAAPSPPLSTCSQASSELETAPSQVKHWLESAALGCQGREQMGPCSYQAPVQR